MLVSNRLGLLRLKICSGSCALVALDSACDMCVCSKFNAKCAQPFDSKPVSLGSFGNRGHTQCQYRNLQSPNANGPDANMHGAASAAWYKGCNTSDVLITVSEVHVSQNL